MLLTVTSGGPPTGSYAARFAGIEETTHDEFGAGLRWKFEVTQGEQAGKVASRTTGLRPTAKNGCGKMLAGVLGRELRAGEQLDPHQFVGREYLIVVGPTENGSTRVEAVVPKT
jgi:hypothetical protein